MYAISRHPPKAAKGCPTTPIAERSAIEACWRGAANHSETKVVQDLLKRIHTNRQWLACECTSDPKDPPLITPVQTGSNMSMRRIMGRASHASGCCFEFEQVQSNDDNPGHLSEASNPEPATQPKFLDLGGAVSLAKPSSGSSTGSKHTSPKRTSSLAPQLFWLAHQSGLQRWPHRDASPARVLRHRAATVYITPQLTLDNVLYCDPQAWTNAEMEPALSRTQKVGMSSQAILICPVINADRKERWVQLAGQDTHTEISGSLDIAGLAFGTESGSIRFPMLMFAKVVRDSSGTRIASAYLHPCVSTTDWMLVDSDYERQALRLIQSACNYLGPWGIGCSIDKPVYDWQDTGARPDFVVNGVGPDRIRTLVIETMGFDTLDYAKAKSGTLQKLRGHAVFVDRRHLQNKDIDDRLRNAILSALRPPRMGTGIPP